MTRKDTHLIDLFAGYTELRQAELRGDRALDTSIQQQALEELLGHRHLREESVWLREAYEDPYFPADMLKRTLFADVVGMRFFISKRRPELEPVLAAELIQWARAFLVIRRDVQRYFDSETVTCIPLDGRLHPLPQGQWCNLCGVCCQIGGVPPTSPSGIRYPGHWPALLSGSRLDNQQLCPFLFQYFGRPFYFCSIHNIKPIACRAFGEEDCRRRQTDILLHS